MNELLTSSVARLFETSAFGQPKPDPTPKINPAPLEEEEEASLVPNSMTLNHWITIEGPKRLKESLKKLSLTPETCKRSDFSNYSADELNTIK